MTRSTVKGVTREQELSPEKSELDSYNLKQIGKGSCSAEARTHLTNPQTIPLGHPCIFKKDWVNSHTLSTSTETVNNGNADSSTSP